MADEARGRYADETKEPPLGAQGSFTRATQLLRRNGPGDGVEAESLLLPILDGDADASGPVVAGAPGCRQAFTPRLDREGLVVGRPQRPDEPS